jgi:hypothetical protein
MAVNFPDSPTLDQIFVDGSKSWRWDGIKWGPAYSEALDYYGDITAVIAGTGLNGGGTDGDVTLNLTTPVAIVNGGTGATSASVALTNLGGAPINSPIFTGDPRAPTPAPGDNDTSIATTAFVKSVIGSGSGTSSVIVVSDTPPSAPVQGTGWWDSIDAQLYIWYDDGNSTQWVPATTLVGGVGGGSGGGIEEAPLDGLAYGRQSAAWTHVLMAANDIVDGGNF